MTSIWKRLRLLETRHENTRLLISDLEQRHLNLLNEVESMRGTVPKNFTEYVSSNVYPKSQIHNEALLTATKELAAQNLTYDVIKKLGRPKSISFTYKITPYDNALGLYEGEQVYVHCIGKVELDD